MEEEEEEEGGGGGGGFEHGKTYVFVGKDSSKMMKGRSKSLEVYDPSGRLVLNGDSNHHPWDPHLPSFSRWLPESMRPFPSFEGWYTRIVDPVEGFSVAVIMASNYATGESQVTLLFSPSQKGGITQQGGTHAVAVITKLAWDERHPKEGPEGWVKGVALFPTHWYIYSLGSRARYTFRNLEEDTGHDGEGYSHQEKNWGSTFPSGHVWLQALSHDNSSQLVMAGAYFKIGSWFSTPYIFSVGYRSSNHHVDIRSNDIGSWFNDIQISAKEGKFSVVGKNSSHTIHICVEASPESFSNPILAPIGKLKWEPACRESFLATVHIKLYKHSAWGIFTPKKLVEKRTFTQAALEFGEDLLNDFHS